MSSIIASIILRKRLGLRLGAAAELDLVEFADAVDERRYLRAEFLFDVGQGSFSVFDGVVQDRGDNRLEVEVHLREFLCDGDRMRDVGLTGFTRLAIVGFGAELVGGRYLLELLLIEIGTERIEQAPQPVVALASARNLGQECRGIVHATIIPRMTQ